jgi:hypothetical protein
LHAARFSANSSRIPVVLSMEITSFVLSSSEVGALGRLGQLLVGWRGHVSSDLDENCFHGEVAFPVGYAWKLGEIDLSRDISVSGTIPGKPHMCIRRDRDCCTLPLLPLTQGRLTLLMKVTSGGESGY